MNPIRVIKSVLTSLEKIPKRYCHTTSELKDIEHLITGISINERVRVITAIRSRSPLQNNNKISLSSGYLRLLISSFI